MEDKRIKSRQDFYDIVARKGGILHGEYVNNSTNVEIECGICHGATNHVNILCHKCGNNWNVEPHSVLRRNWCPHCKQSRGEYSIMSWLKKYPNEVLYQTQYKFYGDRHAYDFLLYYNNMYYLVEFDGIQHFEYICHFHKTEDRFKERIKADMFKNELASYNNIPLLRISYLELEYVEQWLEYFLLNPCNIMYSNPELYTKTYALTQ